jgi:hypothetical protein
VAADPNPATEREMYLNKGSHELADAPIQSHRYRLEQFVQRCDQIDSRTSPNLLGEPVVGST